MLGQLALDWHCFALIRREPRPWTAKNFGGIEWLAESSIACNAFGGIGKRFQHFHQHAHDGTGRVELATSIAF